MFKKWFCKHDYHQIGSYEYDKDPNDLDFEVAIINILYCPKCKHEKELPEYKAKALINKQNIDKAYEAKKSEWMFKK